MKKKTTNKRYKSKKRKNFKAKKKKIQTIKEDDEPN